MTLRNPAQQLRALVAGPPTQIGTVTAITPTGPVVTLLGGGEITVRGTASLGARVRIRDGLIEGGIAGGAMLMGEV